MVKFFDPWCLFGVMSQFKGQRSRSLEGQIWCYSFLSLIIKHFGTFLALLHAGVTFRLTTILSDFDKMTCLCMGGYLDFRDPLHPYFGSFLIDLHVLLDLGEGKSVLLRNRSVLKKTKFFLRSRMSKKILFALVSQCLVAY